jgi:hypothetical protein
LSDNSITSIFHAVNKSRALAITSQCFVALDRNKLNIEATAQGHQPQQTTRVFLDPKMSDSHHPPMITGSEPSLRGDFAKSKVFPQ